MQNQALRIALGTWQSTAISNLQVEANIVPLNLYIQQQCIIQYYKIRTMGPTNKTYELLFNNEDIRNLQW